MVIPELAFRPASGRPGAQVGSDWYRTSASCINEGAKTRRIESTMSTPAAEQAAPNAVLVGSAPPATDFPRDELIRSEIYGLEHLEAHAATQAGLAQLAERQVPGNPLLRRFVANG